MSCAPVRISRVVRRLATGTILPAAAPATRKHLHQTPARRLAAYHGERF
jgi:hypothetical protein